MLFCLGQRVVHRPTSQCFLEKPVRNTFMTRILSASFRPPSLLRRRSSETEERRRPVLNDRPRQLRECVGSTQWTGETIGDPFGLDPYTGLPRTPPWCTSVSQSVVTLRDPSRPTHRPSIDSDSIDSFVDTTYVTSQVYTFSFFPSIFV